MPEQPDAKVIPLGERLRLHRTERGLSQAQAARELEVARTAYRLWEMEAAKPSPDRWRLIAGWLGVSISTMLLGEDLIDEEDADAADLIAGRAARAGEAPWDDVAGAGAGDFFQEERAMIDRESLSGNISPAESGRLTASLDRVLASVQSRDAVRVPGEFRKQLVADGVAPRLARQALVITAAGIADAVVDRAELLTSELVTNSVERAEGALIWLAITVRPSMLRVEVADASSGIAKPDDRARWSLAIVAELASRWGGGHQAGLNIAWFEIDIPA